MGWERQGCHHHGGLLNLNWRWMGRLHTPHRDHCITVRSFTKMWTSATDALLSADLTDAINTLVPLTHTMYAWSHAFAPYLIASAIYTRRFDTSTVTSALPLNTDTLLATFNALPTRTCILALLIVLPATLATKLDKFRAFSHMDTLFPPCNASRARSLIITLLIIPTTVLASQFCTIGF